MESTLAPPSALLTQREAAELLRVSLSTIRRACKRGELRTVRIGMRRVFIRRADLDSYLTGATDPSITGEGADDGQGR